MNAQLLEQVTADGVATLTLNRPQSLNALSTELIAALNESTARLAVDPAVRVVVITGAGDAFCAGGDVGQMRTATGADSDASATTPAALRRGMEVSRWLHEMDKPTVAVIPGAAAGAGLALALACDVRISTVDAKFTTAYARIGLTGDFGISYFLTRSVGPALARELLLTARSVKGAEAVAIGLVHRAVERKALASASAEVIQQLASLPRGAVRAIKANLDVASHRPLNAVLDVEAENFIEAVNDPEFRELIARFASSGKA